MWHFPFCLCLWCAQNRLEYWLKHHYNLPPVWWCPPGMFPWSNGRNGLLNPGPDNLFPLGTPQLHLRPEERIPDEITSRNREVAEANAFLRYLPPYPEMNNQAGPLTSHTGPSMAAGPLTIPDTLIAPRLIIPAGPSVITGPPMDFGESSGEEVRRRDLKRKREKNEFERAIKRSRRENEAVRMAAPPMQREVVWPPPYLVPPLPLNPSLGVPPQRTTHPQPFSAAGTVNSTTLSEFSAFRPPQI